MWLSGSEQCAGYNCIKAQHELFRITKEYSNGIIWSGQVLACDQCRSSLFTVEMPLRKPHEFDWIIQISSECNGNSEMTLRHFCFDLARCGLR